MHDEQYEGSASTEGNLLFYFDYRTEGQGYLFLRRNKDWSRLRRKDNQPPGGKPLARTPSSERMGKAKMH